jgi:Cu/Ag efflux protein CusF
MRKVTFVTLFAAALVAPAALAQGGAMAVQSSPGSVTAAQTVHITATITKIDPASREVTLKGPKGNEIVVVANDQVKNFAQMKVGDTVNADYIEALSLDLKKGGGMQVGKTADAGMKSAAAGTKPGAIAGRQVTVIADVVDVDPARQVVTLKGPQRTVELKVNDPAQFKMIAKGDQVQATYTQAVAVAVEPAKK